MENNVYSKITGKTYNPNKMVRIVNIFQSQKYIDHGAEVYDIYISKNMVVFVFSREDTKELYDLWCKHELV